MRLIAEVKFLRCPRSIVRWLFAALAGFALGGCAANPPRDQHDLCAVFEQRPEWYDHAVAAEERWGTPAHILMAFVKQESAFQAEARPPRPWLLGFIPLPRESSAYGYGQVQDPAWKDYRDSQGGWFKSRDDMEDVLDFIGWYNDLSGRRLGISKWDPKHLYLAYHQGHTGYRRGTWRGRPEIIRIAERVERWAREYGAQLRRCEEQFKCRKFYQIWPFCRA